MIKRILCIIFCCLTAFTCLSLGGCSLLRNKINEYSRDKEECSLNEENVTQFTYKSQSYTILENIVSNESLGNWVGYIRRLAVVDEGGRVLMQEDSIKASFTTLQDLKNPPEGAKYVVPFLNVYESPKGAPYMIVDAGGKYHLAVLSSSLSDKDKVYNLHCHISYGSLWGNMAFTDRRCCHLCGFLREQYEIHSSGYCRCTRYF